MKLVFAAPDNFLPSLPTALASQASRLHFCRKLVFAAPASGLPSFPTALLSQVSCAMAEPSANIDTRAARKKRFMVLSLESRSTASATSRWQLCGKATSLSQAHGRGPWQVLARNCRFRMSAVTVSIGGRADVRQTPPRRPDRCTHLAQASVPESRRLVRSPLQAR